MTKTILEMRGITKTFPGVKALSDVNLDVREAEIHAIVGENGAGKSTLMKVLSGVYPVGSYDGKIIYKGEEQHFKTIADSEAKGIVIIHQELALVPLLSITENLFLGNERASRGVIDWEAAHEEARGLLARVGLTDAPQTPVGDLGIGKQQLVEIAKALAKDVRLLILDEPTAALGVKESRKVLELIQDVRSRGTPVVLISHNMPHVFEVADRIHVHRLGKRLCVIDPKDYTMSDAVAFMTGAKPAPDEAA